MSNSKFSTILALILVAGCSTGSDGRVMVKGAGPDDLLKLRSGPGLEHDIIMGLPDGTRLVRRGCKPTGGRTWCRVSLADSPKTMGYVSAEYLAVF
ncbi:SH3 domain-containing protein [Paracoccus saliphilus]|uniref:SH3 domain-containing protein n=1 Tax=Paracoccus saliphilus TaxID=405559 RepID=A0AA45W6K8_9RHOB|nr:SH3 domain-containing protein [Paracoccus saliphilus]WCR02918.1 SH3 domain-containing protein [Paracoccus saliphilus]SIT02977.1 SH3 domain-containing protein [Paracoccus saliphilus]